MIVNGSIGQKLNNEIASLGGEGQQLIGKEKQIKIMVQYQYLLIKDIKLINGR